MAKYLVSIHENEDAYSEENFEANMPAVMAAHQAFTAEVSELGGTLLGGEALQPLPTATFLRGTRTPGVEATDNPAAGLKEVFGGFYIFEAPDEATARAIAEKCPAPFGYVELRPVMEFN